MTALTFVLGSGVSELRFDMDTENYLDPQDPARIDYNAFRRQFENDDSMLLIIESDHIFSFEFLTKLKKLHEELRQKLPLLDEITSLVNARFTYGEGDSLVVGELLEKWPKTEADLELLKKRVFANPVYINTLISENGRYTAITMKFLPGRADTKLDAGVGEFEMEDSEQAAPATPSADERPPILEGEALEDVMQSLNEVIAHYKSKDFPIYLTGNPELSYALTKTARDDMTLFSVITNLVIGLLLFLLFRRFSGVFLPLLVVLLPLWATLGIMGFVDLPLTPSTQQLPSLLVAVCVGNAVHLLALFYRKYDAGVDKEEAMVYALGHSGLAVIMTSLTTAGGLGSFIISDLAPTRGLGIAAPTGVLLALVYALVSLPALVAILPLRRKQRATVEKGSSLSDRSLIAIGAFASNRPWFVVTVWSVLGIVSLYGASQLELSHKPLSWFPKNFPTRVAAEVANREMKGLMPLEVIVDSGRDGGLYSPDLLRRIGEFQRRAKEINIDGMVAGQAISMVDILKETNRALHRNNEKFYVVPNDPKLVAQELLLFENSGSDDLEELVDTQFRKARVSLLVSYEDGFRYIKFLKEVDVLAKQTIGGAASVQTTGLIKLWVRTIAAMLSSTAKSYGIAILVIAPLMVLLMGEWRMGLLSLIPNLIPIFMGLGLMKLCGITFNMFTMTIGSIVIGMAVDDTIHFMHGFLRYRRQGADAATAVRETLLTTGNALVITSLAISTGFFVQVFGTMISIRHSGFITGVTILIALLADLILSPAIVILATRFAERKAQRKAARKGPAHA